MGRRLRVLWRVIAYGLALGIGVALAVTAFFGSAVLTDRIWTMAAVSALVLAASAFALSWLAGRVSGVRRRRRAALAASLVALLGLAGVSSATVFRPMSVKAPAPAPADNTRFWDLPTGSRIAYVHLPAPKAGAERAPPLIFLHGGPGVPSETMGAVAPRIAQAGFDVYLYDQVGGGLSSRLRDARDYTVARHVADLEAIRRKIGAEKAILVGQSWGATLAAYYLAAHPDRVRKVVFTSPGALWEPALRGRSEIADRLPPQERRRAQALIFTPRVVSWEVLRRINPQAALRLVPERELDGRFAAYLQAVTPGAHCRGGRPVVVRGAGWYANRFTQADQQQAGDPRPALRKVQVPALILRGECDYIAEGAAQQYLRALPKAALIEVPGAGHVIAQDQPGAYLAALLDFLQR